MTRSIHHLWRHRLLTVLAIAAVLVATGSQLASAKPAGEKSERDLDRELCDLGGGAWWEFGSNYGCVFDDFELVCENDGADCKFCEPDKRCERIVDESYRQALLDDNQQVVEPEPTPQKGPRGRGRSTPVDQPKVVAPESTAVPAPSIIESPAIDPVVVMIDPA